MIEKIARELEFNLILTSDSKKFILGALYETEYGKSLIIGNAFRDLAERLLDKLS